MLTTNNASATLFNRAQLKAHFNLTKSDRTPTKKLQGRYLAECHIIATPTPTTTPTQTTSPIPATIVLLILLTILALVGELVVIPILRFTFNQVIRTYHRYLVPRLMDAGILDYRALQ
jgi:hypothetical protein